MPRHERPLTILVAALGGEGGGVLAEWLVDTAARCGHAAQATSIPGVAQRTGSTTYYVEIAPTPGERAPVFSLYPVPGALDLLVASELLEAARQASLGVVSPERTRVIASTARTLTTAEKMQLADGRASDSMLLRALRETSRRLDTFDMTAAAERSGTILSSVLLGAIAASGLLPFTREAFEASIRAYSKGVEASLAGFAAGFVAMSEGAEQPVSPQGSGHAAELSDEHADQFPKRLHPILGAGYARLREWQDEAYARLYLERVNRILEAERAIDPNGYQRTAATREAARFLASWMAFDDIVRVADLKSRASRLARVRGEVRAEPDDVVRIYDHFKPGVPELAALLPASLASALKRWDARRIANGREPLAWPIKLPVHSIAGLATLRILASFKWLRRHGERFAAEQRDIEQWLAAVESGLRRDWALGNELALCGRLVKGYGATNERGKANLLHLIGQLVDTKAPKADRERAAAIRAAREAALADDAGKALDAALVSLGATPRPVKAQPIRFVRPAARRVA